MNLKNLINILDLSALYMSVYYNYVYIDSDPMK